MFLCLSGVMAGVWLLMLLSSALLPTWVLLSPARSTWSHKHRRYDEAFKGSRYDFVPVVFETTGAVNEEGSSVLRQIIRFAALRSGMGLSRFAGRAWARVSVCIQSSVAQSIPQS